MDKASINYLVKYIKNMTSKTATLTVLFADISGSTSLFEVLGDSTARAIIADALNALSKIVSEHGGNVIKTIGDEIMCTFPDVNKAANAAIKMQEKLENIVTTKKSSSKVRIRVGFHHGSALIEKGGDVFGDVVNVAARMTSQAKGGQIITTKTTKELLPPKVKENSRLVDRVLVKGKKETIEIFEIIWQKEDVTRMVTRMLKSVPKVSLSSLEVKYKDKTLVVDSNKTGIVMGRSLECDLPIDEKLASRRHVRIELRHNKFFIIDQSTNGTHVKLESSGNSFLRRDEIPIISNGEISLGKSFAEQPTEIVTLKLNTP